MEDGSFHLCVAVSSPPLRNALVYAKQALSMCAQCPNELLNFPNTCVKFNEADHFNMSSLKRHVLQQWNAPSCTFGVATTITINRERKTHSMATNTHSHVAHTFSTHTRAGATHTQSTLTATFFTAIQTNFSQLIYCRFDQMTTLQTQALQSWIL